jgi:hypothetical protein
MREFHYRIPWQASGRRPGHHRSRSAGAGHEFRGHAPLLRELDARRLDVHASLRDPFGRAAGLWHVRTYDQRSAIRVVLLADLSASMGVDAARRKLALLAEFTAALAYSAWRAGDAFGCFGADQRLRPEFTRPPSHARAVGPAVAQALRGFRATGTSAAGLFDAARAIGRERALVFLASDFHLPDEQLEALLRALGRHGVVPVVLWDDGDTTLPASGFATAVDAESGARRFLWLRPALRARFEAQVAQRRQDLAARLARHGTQPLVLAPPFDVDAVNAYFHAPGRTPVHASADV